MEKLKLKHLAPYLPYGLNFIFNLNDVHGEYKKENRIKMLTCDSMNLCIMIGKPILRPLSDLTKEIDVHGKRFIPIDIIFPKEDYKKEFDRKVSIVALELQGAIDFSCTPFCIVQKLFEWHFDVFGLIDKGLAIDINSI